MVKKTNPHAIGMVFGNVETKMYELLYLGNYSEDLINCLIFQEFDEAKKLITNVYFGHSHPKTVEKAIEAYIKKSNKTRPFNSDVYPRDFVRGLERILDDVGGTTLKYCPRLE